MFIALAKFFREKQDLHVYIGEDANENKFSLASSPIYTCRSCFSRKNLANAKSGISSKKLCDEIMINGCTVINLLSEYNT